MAAFQLHGRMRVALERLIVRDRDAREVVRAYALLWLDAGVAVAEIARRLGVARRSVYNWVQRFEARHGRDLEARLADGARSGRPPTAKGTVDPLLEDILDRDPREWGYRATTWTAPLLALHLEREHALKVSSDSVSRALARRGIRWKRPRHSLSARPDTWRQAKGGLKRGCSSGPARSS